MDYKYIEQLLDSYWQCETSLEEEQILRTFFSQKEVPASLLPYRHLFAYEQSEPLTDVLGDDFDRRMLALTGSAEPVKARRMSLTDRLKPLFKAAAIVAIILTLGNAAQVAFDQPDTAASAAQGQATPNDGPAVVKADTASIDTMQQAKMEPSLLLKQELVAEPAGQ